MSRTEALRARLPGPLRPFTRGVWPYVWVAVAGAGALALLGGPGFERAASARETSRMHERLVASMRGLIATEGAESERREALDAWIESGAPGRIAAPSVEIGMTRLRERIESMAADAGEGVRVLPDRGVAAQRETLLEPGDDGRGLYLVRVPIEIESQTMASLVRFLERVDSDDALWLRPGNTTILKQVGRRGDTAVLRVSAAWALVEVRPEGS